MGEAIDIVIAAPVEALGLEQQTPDHHPPRPPVSF